MAKAGMANPATKIPASANLSVIVSLRLLCQFEVRISEDV
jgi:hypothetical protein